MGNDQADIGLSRLLQHVGDRAVKVLVRFVHHQVHWAHEATTVKTHVRRAQDHGDEQPPEEGRSNVIEHGLVGVDQDQAFCGELIKHVDPVFGR